MRYKGFSNLKALVAALALAGFALGQMPTGVAHVKAPAEVQAQAHSTATAVFEIAIDSGYHIQSNHPKLDYLIPTSLSITPAGGVRVTSVVWPKAQDHKFSFAPDQPLAVFEGTVRVPVTLATGARGTQILHGSFRYQACNDQLCRPPVTEPFTLTVTIR